MNSCICCGQDTNNKCWASANGKVFARCEEYLCENCTAKYDYSSKPKSHTHVGKTFHPLNGQNLEHLKIQRGLRIQIKEAFLQVENAEMNVGNSYKSCKTQQEAIENPEKYIQHGLNCDILREKRTTLHNLHSQYSKNNQTWIEKIKEYYPNETLSIFTNGYIQIKNTDILFVLDKDKN